MKDKDLETLQMKSEQTNSAKDTGEYLRTALEAGKIALGSGAETARCEYIVNNMLKGSGSTDYDTSVISTSIIASLNGKTLISTVENWSTNLNRITTANTIAHQVADGRLSIQEAGEKLKLLNQTVLYGFVLRLIAFVAVTVSMPILMNGSYVDCAGAAVCGLIMGFTDALFRRIRVHSFALTVVQTFIVIIVGSLMAILSHGAVTLAIIIPAAITPLFPGLALTNAVRDTLQGDYVSGAGRFLEAIVKALGVSLGVAFGLFVSTFITGTMAEEMLDSPFEIIADNQFMFFIYGAAALIYSVGYCILFQVTLKFVIWGALVGCIAKTLALFINYHTETILLGTFIATVAAAVLAQIFSRIFKTPAIPFMIAGIMALVPGRSLYNSVATIIAGEFTEGAHGVMETLLVAGVIAAAIFLVDTISLTTHRIKNKKIIRH